MFALGLRRSLPDSRAVTTSLVLFGVMGILAGIFPDQPYPWPGRVHDLVSIVGFISIILCQFLLWIRLRNTSARERESDWGRYRTYSLVSGVLSIILLVGLPESISGVVVTGLKQRAFLAVPWLWIEVMALRLFRFIEDAPVDERQLSLRKCSHPRTSQMGGEP